jgi:hypothetical protein
MYTDETENEVTTEETPVTLVGSGGARVGEISIYYPAGTVGTINVLRDGAAVLTVPADGTGVYTGSGAGLAADEYGLALIVMKDGVPTIIDTGTLTVIE